jgi:hypothetical protein
MLRIFNGGLHQLASWPGCTQDALASLARPATACDPFSDDLWPTFPFGAALHCFHSAQVSPEDARQYSMRAHLNNDDDWIWSGLTLHRSRIARSSSIPEAGEEPNASTRLRGRRPINRVLANRWLGTWRGGQFPSRPWRRAAFR